MRKFIPVKNIGGLAQFLDKTKNNLFYNPSDLDEVLEGAYMHQTHVDEPCTESTESQDKPLVAEESNATTIKEKEAETTPVPPLENEVDLEEGSGMCLAIERDHQVQRVNSRDHTPKSVHEIIEGLEEKASNLDIDTQNMSLQCAHQVMNEVNEVQTRSQENQADDHPSSPIDFPSPWLDDTSSMGTRRESLRSSSPMPVPSSPFASDPTPPSSLPSSPLIDGATDATVPLVAQDKLTQPNELHSGDDDHPSTVDIPVVAVLGTRLEQERKEQVRMSKLRIVIWSLYHYRPFVVHFQTRDVPQRYPKESNMRSYPDRFDLLHWLLSSAIPRTM